MINFFSTFPPMMCGIGTYTEYLVSKIPQESWKVTSFELDEFLRTDESSRFKDRVSYEISLSSPHLPPIEDKVLWFQHSFGMWGRESPAFIQLVKEAKDKGKKVISSFHTIHFESSETESGMQIKEEKLLQEVLPFLDAMTVFTDGAYQAVIRGFPQYKDKVTVLRHGVHIHPQVSQEKARERLLKYLIDHSNISPAEKQKLGGRYSRFFEEDVILLGNFGFITTDKEPLSLYRLGELIRKKLPNHRVIVLFIGMIQKRKDKRVEEYLLILEKLRVIHDGNENLFFEDYLQEDIFPFAFKALDFPVFWQKNATQSGRMAHAMGTGACVVGRRIEGIGETLDLAGLPSGVNFEDMAEKIASLVLEPRLREEAERSALKYAQEFSFEKQARKHLLIEEVVRRGEKLPILDRTKPSITWILPNLALGRRAGLEDLPKETDAFLNMANDVDLYPPPPNYHKIPLIDGTSPPVEKMKEAIDWIKRNIGSGKVLVFCRYGSGRSASVVIGYLCNLGFKYEEAVRFVSSKRPGINPLPQLEEVIRIALSGT